MSSAKMKTSKRLKRWAPFLNALTIMKNSDCYDLLKSASPHLIAVLSECSDNLLRGSVPISSVHLKKLKQHRAKLHTLASPQVGLRRTSVGASRRDAGRGRQSG